MSYSEVAVQWATDVVSGKDIQCRYVKLACRRFLKDLKRANRKKGWTYYYDAEEADRRCKWIELLPHVKGKWAAKRERIVLSPWQVFIVCNLFGWRSVETGYRRFREAYNELPRKNGKSLLAAAIALCMFAADGEFGAEVYSGATTEKQAWEVFRPAKQICERTPDLRDYYDIEVNAKSLVILSQGNRFEPVIGNPGDGASPSCAIVDEYHEHKSSDLVDTMQTGMGAREQPLLFIITTAGSDFGGPCREKRSDLIAILKGSVKDETVFGILFTIDDKDDWDTEKALRKANPNFGISVNREFLLAELAKARRSATKQSAFKTKHLNLWVGAKESWMNMLAYQRCRRKSLSLEDHVGMRCFAALDLASKIDIADLVLLFPPQQDKSKWTAFAKHYLPEETVEKGNPRYLGWSADDWLTSTPGNVTDYRYIAEDLDAFKSQFELEVVAYDPFQATQFATERLEEGYPMLEFGQIVKNMSEPMKQLEALILRTAILFQWDPVLLWMFGNVVARKDKKDNIFPIKERDENKIDGVVALIMALACAMKEQGENDSIYETTAL